MATLFVRPSSMPTQEEREHNRALLERYMPGFMEFFVEARRELGATISGPIKFHIPDGDLEFVKTVMDSTKELVR
jgi:hypothetical protein